MNVEALTVNQNCVNMKIFNDPNPYSQLLFSALLKIKEVPKHYTVILLKMKTCKFKADDNSNEIYEGLRRTSAPDWPKT